MIVRQGHSLEWIPSPVQLLMASKVYSLKALMKYSASSGTTGNLSCQNNTSSKIYVSFQNEET